jgi:hypothetical protein
MLKIAKRLLGANVSILKTFTLFQAFFGGITINFNAKRYEGAAIFMAVKSLILQGKSDKD